MKINLVPAEIFHHLCKQEEHSIALRQSLHLTGIEPLGCRDQESQCHCTQLKVEVFAEEVPTAIAICCFSDPDPSVLGRTVVDGRGSCAGNV